MTLTLITAPTVQPITLATAKEHLRVDHTDDDDLITALIVAAVSHVDGRDGVLGRALVSQTWEIRLDEFPCGELTRERGIRVPLPPLIEVVSVKYVDSDGVLQTLSSSAYQVVAGGFGQALIVEAYGETWPSTRDEPDAVRVQFTAGYVAPVDSPPVAGEGVPGAILSAIKLMIGHLYESREGVVMDARIEPAELPLGVRALLAPYRVGTLGL